MKQFFVAPDIAKAGRQALFEFIEIRDVLFDGLKTAEQLYEQAVDTQRRRNQPY